MDNKDCCQSITICSENGDFSKVIEGTVICHGDTFHFINTNKREGYMIAEASVLPKGSHVVETHFIEVYTS